MGKRKDSVWPFVLPALDQKKRPLGAFFIPATLVDGDAILVDDVGVALEEVIRVGVLLCLGIGSGHCADNQRSSDKQDSHFIVFSLICIRLSTW
jgi:hypothetical protein